MSNRLANASAAIGYSDRRRGGIGRRRDVSAHHGGRRIVATERGAGNQALASARRGGRGNSRRVDAAVRRRGVRPGDQPPPQLRVVDRDRPGAAARRHLLRAARSGLPLWPSWSSTSSGRKPEAWAAATSGHRERAGTSRRPADRGYARGAAASRVLRHRRRYLLPAQGDLDGAGLHAWSAIATGCGNCTSASRPTDPSSPTPRGSSSRPASRRLGYRSPLVA